MRRRELLGALFSGLAAACSGQAPSASVARSAPRARTREEARRRLTELGSVYEKLMGEHGAHEHGRYAGTLTEGPSARAAMERLRAREREVFREAKQILDRFGDSTISPRRAELWRKGALGLDLLGDARAAELSDELEAVINDHQYERDGRAVQRSELTRMARSDDPRERRRVRELQHGLHRKAQPIAAALIRRRQELADGLGLRSYWTALLEVRGGEPAVVERILGELGRRTERTFVRALRPGPPPVRRMGFSRRLVFAWDLDHLIERAAPVPDDRFSADRALPTVERIYSLFGFDLRRPGLGLTVRDFAFNGQAIGVHVPDDVRLVVRPNPGMRFYAVLLHELGHAFAMMSTRAKEPLYKGYEWVPGLFDPALAEGVAEIFARLLDEPRVLRELVGLSDADAQAVVRARRLQALVSIRRGLVATSFERAALEQRGANLDTLSLDVERRFSGTIVPPNAEPTWAISPLLATYPVYVQSYNLAAVMAVQVREALWARFGPDVVSRRAGAFLAEKLLADGSRWSLREKLVRTAGAPLDPLPLLRFVNAG